MRTLLAALALALASPSWAQLAPTNAVSGLSTNPPATGQAPIVQPTVPPHTHPPQKWDPPFWLQTLITVVISAVTALLATWYKDRERKRDLLQREFTESIKDLRPLSETVCQQVVTHLIADPFSATKQRQSKIAIMTQLKLCGDRVQRAAGLLNEPDRAPLEAAFLTWKSALTGSPFPVSIKEQACEPHDQPVIQVNTAQEKWSQYLDRLTRECMSGSLRIPLKPRA